VQRIRCIKIVLQKTEIIINCISHLRMARRDPQKLAITSPTSGGRSIGIVRPQTQTMELGFLFFFLIYGGLYNCKLVICKTYDLRHVSNHCGTSVILQCDVFWPRELASSMLVTSICVLTLVPFRTNFLPNVSHWYTEPSPFVQLFSSSPQHANWTLYAGHILFQWEPYRIEIWKQGTNMQGTAFLYPS
jgi:hypothetical protein